MWIISLPCLALPVENLYVGEVLVVSQDESQLADGARAAMRQVLIRVSGSTDVLNNSMIDNALKRPAAYYYQYGYESTDRTLVVDNREVPARLLKVSFDPSAISRLLRQGGFPVWGSNRPGVLLWVAVSDGAERRIVTESDPFAGALTRQARVRGLPLLFPLMDLEDASKLTSAEVWGLFLDRIDLASTRYSPDVVLAGRVQHTGGQWSGRWTYRLLDQWKTFENVGYDEEDLVSGVINVLADQLAQRYAVDSSRGSLTLRVEGVKTLEDYAHLSAYLESLTPVVDSSVEEVDGNEILFRLSTEGQVEQLREIIELDDKLVLINAGGPGEPLHYQWTGK
ncbi:MAG: DUF2066 domain-containing protein [Pseudomonadales bacterium]|nr:DUF2066 domain-containing protein [Pseudomonadales bacterium]